MSFFKTCGAPLALALSLVASSMNPGFAKEQGATKISLDPSFSLSLPEGWIIQEAAAITVRENGNVLLFHRGEHQLLEFNKDGLFIREIGAGLFKKPHGLRLDNEGNIWATDSETHLVLRFSPAGNVTMILGKKDYASRGWFDRGYNVVFFDQPLDVGFDSHNNIYVVDRGNERIVKFSSDGDFLSEWGEKGEGQGEFDFPHSIVIDSADKVFVADRENKRIQIFTANGAFLQERKEVGYPYVLLLDQDEGLWVTDARVEKISHYSPGGELIGSYQSRGKDAGEFESVHGIAVDGGKHLYTSEIYNWRVQRFDVSD